MMALRKLYFLDDIMERYHVKSKNTARKYMNQMGASGSPLFVTEEMINDWEDEKKTPHEKMKAVYRKRRPLPKEMVIPGRKKAI